MPNRYLRESFKESEAVNAVGFQAEVLWIRLVVTVDDFGRCEANPKLLRPKLFPLRLEQVREAELSRWIAECEKAGLLRLYTVDGKQYLQLEKWEQGRAISSKYPPPPTYGNICEQTHADANKCLPPLPIPTPTPVTTTIPTPTTEWQALPAELANDEFKTKWEEYCAYRRERKLSRLGAHSITEKWKELAAMGSPVAIEAIRHSIANGWTGIFPPKTHGQRREVVKRTEAPQHDPANNEF